MTALRAKTLEDIDKVTEITALDGEQLKQFYVPTDSARDHELPPSSVFENYLKKEPAPFRLLFASHPGAGKSTEINRFRQREKDNFWIVYFSAKNDMDFSQVTHINLILALMEKLYSQGKDDNLIQDSRVIEPVRSWLGSIIEESKISKKSDLVGEGEIGIGGPIGQIIGFSAKLRAASASSQENAKTIRLVINPQIVQLRNYCNQVITEISENLARADSKKKILIIIEETDKLDMEVARDLFVNHTGLLADLKASFVYTAPLYLIHSADRHRIEAYFDTLTLPTIKTKTRDGKRFEPGWDVLHKVLHTRIANQLIDSDAKELAIEMTGGILRDLLRVIKTASEIAIYAGETKISQRAVRSSLDRLKLIYRSSVRGSDGISTTQLYEKLSEIMTAKEGFVPPSEELQRLLYNQAVIEYNGVGWYSLHPLMEEILQQVIGNKT